MRKVMPKNQYIIYSLATEFYRHASSDKARSMLETVSQEAENWSVGKLNRWIGYAQCLLVAVNDLELDDVVEMTERVIAEADKKYGQRNKNDSEH